MAKENIKQTTKIITLILRGEPQKEIQTILNIKQSTLSRKLKRMILKKYVIQVKSNPRTYDVTSKGRILLKDHKYVMNTLKYDKSHRRKNYISSLPVNDMYKKKLNYHDFKVKVPIITKGKTLKKGKTVPINNWIKEYHNIEIPIKLTLEITTRSIILHYNKTELNRDSSFFTQLFRYYNLGMLGAKDFLNKQGYSLDWYRAKVISQHIANQTIDKIDSKIPDSTTTEINLNRKANSLTGKMEQEARAWIDKSRSIAEVETNDQLFEEKLIRMPETVHELNKKIDRNELSISTYAESIKLYDEQIKKHLAAIEEIRDTMKDIRDYIKSKEGSR